jgi:WD40 repeat protein
MGRILAIGSLTLACGACGACGASETAPRAPQSPPSATTATTAPEPSAESLTQQALQTLATQGEQAARPLLEKALDTWLRETNEPFHWFDATDGASSPLSLEHSIANIDPTGSWLARTEDHRITVFDTTSWRRQWIFDAHQGPVHSVTFNPQGTLLWSSGGDHTVRLFDLSTGKLVHTASHQDEVGRLLLSPDGTRIVHRCGLSLCSWKIGSTSPESQRLRLPEACLVLRHWNRDQAIIAGKDGEETCFINPTTGIVEKTLPFITGALVFPSRGDTFLSAVPTARTVQIEVWNASKGSRLRSLATSDDNGQPAIPQTIPSLSPDGHHAVALTRSDQLTRWDTTTGRVARRLNLPSETVRASYLADGRVLLSHASGASFDLTNVQGSEVRPGLRAPRMSYHTLEVTPDGKGFAVGVQDRIQVWSMETGRSLTLHQEDGQRLAALHARGLRVWDLSTKTMVHEVLPAEGQRITAVGFDDRGRLLTTRSVYPVPSKQDLRAGELLLTDLEEPSKQRPGVLLGGHEAIQLSARGERVAVAPPGGGIRVFDLKSSKFLREVSAQGTWSLSPDGAWIAYVGIPEKSTQKVPSLQLVRLSDGKQWTIDQVPQPAGPVAWKNDGSLIAVTTVGSQGGHEVLLVDPASRSVVGRSHLGQPGGSYYLTLLPDGERLVTRHREGGMSFHRVKDGAVIVSLGFLSDGQSWLAWTEPGVFDMDGPLAQELGGCRVGARVLPFPLCATKVRNEGLFEKALEQPR